MTEHAVTDAASNSADLFEIIRTSREASAAQMAFRQLLSIPWEAPVTAFALCPR